MKQLKSTLILALVVALVGGYIYFNERGPVAEEGSTVLVRSSADGPQNIRVVPQAGDGVELTQVNGDWQVAPIKGGKTGDAVAADDAAVKAFADSLAIVQSKTALEKPGPLKEYGLEKPAVTISVDGQKLELGDKSQADSSQMYAKSGEIVALVPVTLLDPTKKSFLEWRDKTLVSVKSEDVKNLTIKAPAVDAAFQKPEDGSWQMTAPVAAKADSSAVDAFVTLVATTQSTAWLDDKGTDLAKWGLEKPAAVITLGDQTLKIGKKLSGGYAAVSSTSPSIIQVPENVFTQANRKPTVWRDKRIADFLVSDVTGVEITENGKTTKFEKVADKWQEAGGKANNDIHLAVEDVLYTVAGWNAQEFKDKPGPDAEYGLDKPVANVKVTTAKESYDVTLGEKGPRPFVKTGSGTVAELPSTSLGTLKTSLKTIFPAKK